MSESQRGKYYAHTCEGKPPQLLKEHLENVAKFCRDGAVERDKELANLIGLAHDLGKYQPSFQRRLAGDNIKVGHSIAGAQELRKLAFCSEKGAKYYTVAEQIACYAIAGHHAGLPDYGSAIDTDDEGGTLTGRLAGKCEDIGAYKDEIELRLCAEVPENYKDKNDFLLKSAFRTRMLFSLLVDGDFIDTEHYMLGERREEQHADLQEFDKRLEAYLKKFKADSVINRTRTNLREQTLKMVNAESNLFVLDMPTGSGKTLTSLNFAIKRAIAKGKKHIIYVIPYTSIIVQIADIFRKIFGPKNVLEHHSDIDYSQMGDEEIRKHDLFTENWDYPLIVTTNVQFFESIYSDKPSRCRKIHNIANSVVCLDEAHILPENYIDPCMSAVKILAEDYNTDFVLMSATMPDYSRFNELENMCDLISDKSRYNVFDRCEIKLLGEKSLDEIASLIDSRPTLIVLNTKKEVNTLYNLISGANKIALTTNLTRHDIDVKIKEIKKALQNGNKNILVVATSLVEAGVDLDFDIVYRELNGLDNILQCAGRCNREGKKQNCFTYVFKNTDASSPDRGTLEGKMHIAFDIIKNSDKIASSENIAHYYNQFFEFDKNNRSRYSFLQYSKISPGDDLRKGLPVLQFQFRTYAKKFNYIDNFDLPILIMNKESEDLLNEYVKCPTRQLKHALNKFIVSVHRWDYDKLNGRNLISAIDFGNGNRIEYLNNSSYYDFELGIKIDTDEDILIF